MTNNFKILIPFFIVLLLTSSGCTTLKSNQINKKLKRPIELTQFYKTLNQITEEYQTNNASTIKVHGFPYIRTNRYLIGYKNNIEDTSSMEQWLEAMRKIDLESRLVEINNLPNKAIDQLSIKLDIPSNKQKIIKSLNNYSKKLSSHDQSQFEYNKLIFNAIKDPSEYHTHRRILGLYPLFAIPTILGTCITYNEFKKWHMTDEKDLKVIGQLETFIHTPSKNKSYKDIKTLLDKTQRNAIGQYQLNSNQLNDIAATYAPIITQDISQSFDKFGKIIWRNDRVTIDTTKPTVYYYPTYTLINNTPTLQINYSIWYEGRFGSNAPLIERGPLDGLTIRVTLNQSAQPVVVDITNSCGCYHFFVPNRKFISSIKTKRFGLDPFVPSWLPNDYPDNALRLRISSSWHQVLNIQTYKKDTAQNTYQLIAYDKLESLEKFDGTTESVFDHKGIMKNSSRIEPLIFFPSGIKSIGYMRQRGKHPVKMIGRAHFTDPNLFNENFNFKD